MALLQEDVGESFEFLRQADEQQIMEYQRNQSVSSLPRKEICEIKTRGSLTVIHSFAYIRLYMLYSS